MKKLRGGFFAKEKTIAYQTPNRVFGQLTPSSCVAAVCRMILSDYGANDLPEAFLRDALETNAEGAYLRQIPLLLSSRNIGVEFAYKKDLTFAKLREAVQKGAAAVGVRDIESVGAHAVVIEKIEADFVCIRDPLPLGSGAAYKLSVEIFLKYWHLPGKDFGLAIIIE